MHIPIRMLVAAAFTSFLAINTAQALTVYSSVDEENAKLLLDAFTKATGVKHADGVPLVRPGDVAHRG